jgi:hypothetical protein
MAYIQGGSTGIEPSHTVERQLCAELTVLRVGLNGEGVVERTFIGARA